MIPALIAGAVVGYAIGKSSDEKKDFQTSTNREQISESDVPEEIRMQIEGESVEDICEKANNFYYGFNGVQQNKFKAKGLYIKAAKLGHSGAKNALKTLYGYDY